MAIPLRRGFDLFPVDRSVNVCYCRAAPLFRRSETAGKRRQQEGQIFIGRQVPGKVDGPVRDCDGWPKLF